MDSRPGYGWLLILAESEHHGILGPCYLLCPAEMGKMESGQVNGDCCHLGAPGLSPPPLWGPQRRAGPKKHTPRLGLQAGQQAAQPDPFVSLPFSKDFYVCYILGSSDLGLFMSSCTLLQFYKLVTALA